MEGRDKNGKTWTIASPESAPCDLKVQTSPSFPAEPVIQPQGSPAQRTGDSLEHKEKPRSLAEKGASFHFQASCGHLLRTLRIGSVAQGT